MIAATRQAKCLNFFLPRSFMNERPRNREAFDEGDCFFLSFYAVRKKALIGHMCPITTYFVMGA